MHRVLLLFTVSTSITDSFAQISIPPIASSHGFQVVVLDP
ncbi:hypothetical protein A2U01_0114531, partial [Trifolium medium]|nr:hypothetical protein [Trifolium medium]